MPRSCKIFLLVAICSLLNFLPAYSQLLSKKEKPILNKSKSISNNIRYNYEILEKDYTKTIADVDWGVFSFSTKDDRDLLYTDYGFTGLTSRVSFVINGRVYLTKYEYQGGIYKKPIKWQKTETSFIFYFGNLNGVYTTLELTPQENHIKRTGNLLIKIRYENNSSTTKKVAAVIKLDTKIGDNDKARIASSLGIVGTCKYLNPVPDFWLAFEDENNPNALIGRGTLAGEGLTKPDRLFIGDWGSNQLGYYTYNKALDEGEEYGDSEILMEWDQKDLAPGASIYFSTLYGMDAGSFQGTNLSLFCKTPYDTLLFNEQQDGYQPFNYIATIRNPGNTTLTNVKARIVFSNQDVFYLSNPLTETMNLSSLASGETKVASWLVYTKPQTLAANHSINVIVTCEQFPDPTTNNCNSVLYVPIKTITKTYTIDPVNFYFDKVSCGYESEIQSTKIKNTGVMAIKVDSIAIHPPFYLADNLTFPFYINQNQEKEIKIKYKPTIAPSVDNGILKIITELKTDIINLSGNSVEVKLRVNPAETLNIDQVKLNQTKCIPFYICNDGEGKLTINNLSPINLPFNFSNNYQFPLTLSSHDSIAFGVCFTPSTKSDVSSEFNINYLSCNNTDKKVILKGTIAKGILYVEKDTLDFGAISCGMTREIKITLDNRGNDVLIINSVENIISPFILKNIPVFPVILNIGEQIDLTFEYNPTDVSSKSIDINIKYDDNISKRITLVGQSSEVIIRITGSDTLKTYLNKSKCGNIMIYNDGTGDLIINSFSNPSFPFSLTYTPSMPYTISPHKSLTLEVCFIPEITGVQKDSFYFSYISCSENKKIIPLTGVGLKGAVFLIDNDPLVIDSVLCTSKECKNVTLKNIGDEESVINEMADLNMPFYINNYSLPINLKPGESKLLNICYKPSNLSISDSVYTTFKIISGTEESASIALLFDAGNQMNNLMKDNISRISNAKYSVINFIKNLRNSSSLVDEAAIYKYSDIFSELQDFTTDKILLENQINTISPGGNSNIRQAIYNAIGKFKGKTKRRYLIILNSGKDQNYFPSISELISYANRLGVSIFSIGLGMEDLAQKDSLKNLSEQTGGRLYETDNYIDLVRTINGIQYQISQKISVKGSAMAPELKSTPPTIEYGKVIINNSKIKKILLKK